jgi:hypothetical protein
MSKKKQSKKPALYMRRLAENEYVQAQFQDAAMALSNASRRIAKRRGRAVEDKKLYDHLREAATSIRNAMSALRHKPAPPPKHNGRKLLALTAAGGGAALLWTRRTSDTAPADLTGSEAGPPAGDFPPPDAAPAPAPPPGSVAE